MHAHTHTQRAVRALPSHTGMRSTEGPEAASGAAAVLKVTSCFGEFGTMSRGRTRPEAAGRCHKAEPRLGSGVRRTTLTVFVHICMYFIYVICKVCEKFVVEQIWSSVCGTDRRRRHRLLLAERRTDWMSVSVNTHTHTCRVSTPLLRVKVEVLRDQKLVRKFRNLVVLAGIVAAAA